MGLELEQDLQRPLGDFRLVGGVAGEELGALDQVIDGRRDMSAIRAGAEEEGAEPAAILRLAIVAIARSTAISLLAGGMSRRPLDPLVGGNVGEQRVDVRNADARQHRLAFAGVERQVAHGSA